MRRLPTLAVVFLLGLLVVLPARAYSLPTRLHGNAPPAGFTPLGSFTGIGSQQIGVVGPGPAGQLFYLSYVYPPSGDFDIVAIDPNTGADSVYPGPNLVGSGFEYRANLAVGNDRMLYMGTWPHAHLLRFNPSTHVYRDLGKPAPSESDILSVTVGMSSKIYGCTFPNAKLFSYDPSTGRAADLGRMDATQNYADNCVDGRDGYIYVGVGTLRQEIVAYSIAAGTSATILTSTLTGIPGIYLGIDANVYAQVGTAGYRLSNGQASLVQRRAPPAPTNVFSDGRTITVNDRSVTANTVTVAMGNSKKVYPYAYQGESMQIYRLGWGPDGNLYGSSYVPAYLFRIGQNPGTLGWLGCGEVYSFIAKGPDLLIAAYDCWFSAPLQIFNPQLAFQLGVNPSLLSFSGEEISWRPQAMIADPTGLVYMGAIPTYGELGGPMVTWNPSNKAVTVYKQLVHDESVNSLASVDGVIVGGTTIFGGPGSMPTQTQAHVFIFDHVKNALTFDTTVPVKTVTDLIAAPNGLVYGFGLQDAKGGDDLIVFDPLHPTAPSLYPSAFVGHAWLYNCIGVLPASTHLLVALAASGVVFLDTDSNSMRTVPAPQPITAGFSIQQGSSGDVDVYFASGSTVYRYLFYPSSRAGRRAGTLHG